MDETIIEEALVNKSNILKNINDLTIAYNSDEDVFVIRYIDPKPAVSYDLEGEIWIRIDPFSKDIVGFEIENFESVFIKKFPEVAKVWKKAKPFCDHKKSREVEKDTICTTFVTILLSFFEEIMSSGSQHISFEVQ